MTEKNESGFTLLEVLVTVVIVAVGLLATAQMLLTAIQQNKNSEFRIDASAAVHTLLNEASTRVTDDATCTSLVANAHVYSRSYLGADYTETVSCVRLGDAGTEHYRISADIVDNRGGRNKTLASSSTIITTVAPAD